MSPPYEKENNPAIDAIKLTDEEYELKYHGEDEPGEPESDVDVTRDNPEVRMNLYFALKETRSEPGLTIDRVAGVIMDAFAREEVAVLVTRLKKFLDL